MALGLFGKLPARRDFVTVGVPRAFLTVWEEWIEAGLRASQEALGDGWSVAYGTAPAWRFWLGATLCGEAMLGAFVPSCDGIGRSYPLTLVAAGDIAPPDQDAREDWFAEAEALLLEARQGSRDYQQTLDELHRLMPPSAGLPAEGIEVHSYGFSTRYAASDARSAIASLAAASHPLLLGSVSLWWTRGTVGREPRAYLLTRGMPEPSFFATLIAVAAVSEG